MTILAAPVDVATLLQVVLRRSTRILLVGAVCGVLGGILGASQPMRYEANGLLLVDSGATEDAQVSKRSTADDILRSPALLASTIGKMNPAEAAALMPVGRAPFGLGQVAATFRAAVSSILEQLKPNHEAERAGVDSHLLPLMDYASGHLKLAGAEGSSALSISFDAGTPDSSASFVNLLMSGYLAAETAARHNATASLDQQLAQRVENARREAEAADARVRDYQASHRLLMLQAGSTIALQLSAEQTELSAAKVDLSNAQAALAANRFAPSRTGAEQASREQQSSVVLQTLAARKTEVLQQLALMNDFGPNYPKRVALEQNLNVVQQQIAVETGKVTQALARDAQVAAKRVATLQALASNAETQAHFSADVQLELAQLSHVAGEKHDQYEALAARAEQAQTLADQSSTARIVSPATPPATPKKGAVAVVAILGFLAGSLATASMSMLRQLLWPKVLSSRGLTYALGTSALGSLPAMKRMARLGMFNLAIDDSHAALPENLRRLRLSARAAASSKTMVLLVTSAIAGEGKTTTAAATARRAAADGLNVLLIEADLRRPSLAQVTGLAPGVGLETLLFDCEDLDTAVVVDPASGLHCLFSTGGFSNPYKLLASDRFLALLTQARQTYDLVVLDAPPTLEAAEAALLSRWSDIVMFVVQANRTPLSVVAEALRCIPEKSRLKIATVLTHCKDDPWQSFAPNRRSAAWNNTVTPPQLFDDRRSRGQRGPVPEIETTKEEQPLRVS